MGMEGKYDVIVLGGGIAGVSAALAAAELGAKTALIERYGYLGGMVTGCYVVALAGANDGKYGKRCVRGNFSKITDRAIKEGFAEWTYWGQRVPHDDCPLQREVTVDPEGFKYVLDQLLAEAKICPYLHAYADVGLCDAEKLSCISLTGKFGEHWLRGDIFVDCTGDADTAEWGGMDFLRSAGGTTFGVRLGGLDVKEIKKQKPEILEIDDIIFNTDGWLSIANENTERFYDGGFVKGADALTVAGLLKTETAGRCVAQKAVEYLRKKKGYENAYIVSIGTHIGHRKTRALFNQYHLSNEDRDVDFPDSIAIAGDVTHDYGYMKIPYRALLPKRIKNVIYAGRCISPLTYTQNGRQVNDLAYELPRLVAPSTATGEAAGVAAALCTDGDIDFTQLAVKDVQQKLKARGAMF